MAADDLFSYVADQLEQRTTLGRLESRGTLRIVLKASGFDPKNVTPKQMCVILASVAPAELESRGVADAQSICSALIARVESEPGDRWQTAQGVDAIFDRLAGS